MDVLFLQWVLFSKSQRADHPKAGSVKEKTHNTLTVAHVLVPVLLT